MMVQEPTSEEVEIEYTDYRCYLSFGDRDSDVNTLYRDITTDDIYMSLPNIIAGLVDRMREKAPDTGAISGIQPKDVLSFHITKTIQD